MVDSDEFVCNPSDAFSQSDQKLAPNHSTPSENFYTFFCLQQESNVIFHFWSTRPLHSSRNNVSKTAAETTPTTSEGFDILQSSVDQSKLVDERFPSITRDILDCVIGPGCVCVLVCQEVTQRKKGLMGSQQEKRSCEWQFLMYW